MELYIYDLYSTLQSAKYNTNKRKKEEGTDRQIYTVVAHINVYRMNKLVKDSITTCMK